jgi:hypothetical protein
VTPLASLDADAHPEDTDLLQYLTKGFLLQVSHRGGQSHAASGAVLRLWQRAAASVHLGTHVILGLTSHTIIPMDSDLQLPHVPFRAGSTHKADEERSSEDDEAPSHAQRLPKYAPRTAQPCYACIAYYKGLPDY